MDCVAATDALACSHLTFGFDLSAQHRRVVCFLGLHTGGKLLVIPGLFLRQLLLYFNHLLLGEVIIQFILQQPREANACNSTTSMLTSYHGT